MLRTHSRPRMAAALLLVIAGALTSTRGAAQATCSQWMPGGSAGGVDGVVKAVCAWDPDGAGPQPWGWAVGGLGIALAGSTVVTNLAFYSPTTGQWSNLGGGTNGSVYALCVRSTGELVVGGSFSVAGSVSCNSVAQWNGTSWTAYGSGCNGVIYALAAGSAGVVYVGGQFTSAGGVAASRVAAWNSSWSALGAGVNSRVYALAVHPNGDLFLGGDFTTAGGIAMPGIARWNPVGYATALTGVAGGTATVHSLSVSTTGVVYLGGNFTSFAGLPANNIATFRFGPIVPIAGALGAGSSSTVFAVIEDGASVYAGGSFVDSGGGSIQGIARWGGSSWASAAPVSNSSSISSIARRASGEMAAGGSFTSLGGASVSNFAWFNGISWLATDPVTDGAIRTMAWMPNGDLVVGGSFSRIGGVACNDIARWNGSVWLPIGSGSDGAVMSVLAMPNGDLYAGGTFSTMGGVVANRIARWNGSFWSQLSSGIAGGSPMVTSLARLQNGDVAVGGLFSSAGGVLIANNTARWNGSAWSTFGSAAISNTVESLVVLPNGNLVAGGSGAPTITNLRAWDGVAWSPVGGGVNGSVLDLALAPNGDLLLTGRFTQAGPITANGIARWDGASWSAFGTGIANIAVESPDCIVSLPTGEVLVGGVLANVGGAPVVNLARWDGSAWTGNGMQALSGSVAALELSPSGRVAVGGSMASVGGVGAKNLAFLQSTCAPATVSAGVGCAGSAGLVTMTATSSPWLGSALTTATTGLAANAFGFALVGLQPTSLPVSLVHPAGLPGCSLYNLGDVLTSFVLPSAGVAPLSLSLPFDPALTGLVVRLQMASVELDAQLAIVAIATSNGLSATLGRY